MSEEVIDFTGDSQAEEDGQIRLRSGINLNDLRGPNGLIFEPEIDESFFENNRDARSYFSNLDDDLDFEELMTKFSADRNNDNESDEEDDPNLSEFENKLRRMKPIQIEVEVDGKKELTTIAGVQKRILKKGLESGGNVAPKSTVTIHYSLSLEAQDEPYDSSTLRGRAERYLLDDGRLLPGIELAIKSMLKNEKAEFIIQPEYGFGKMGCPPRVPGDSQILALIELLNVVQEAEAEALIAMGPEERSKKKTFAEIMKAAQTENVEGNKYIREKEFMMAARRYERGIRLLEDVELNNDQEETDQKKWLVKLYLNHGHTCLQLKRPKRACTDMKKVLQIKTKTDTDTAKAFYRMGKAKTLLGHTEEAIQYHKKALKFKHDDVDIGLEISRLEKEMGRQRKDEKELCMRMFNDGKVPSASASAKNRKFDVDDDFYSDMYTQLEAFKNDTDTEPLYLPSSLGPDEINFTKIMVQELGLEMKERERNNIQQWMIIK